MIKGWNNSRSMRRRGFTVVELLIVISVIGILTSIVLVVYPGYQKRTRDNERKSDVAQVATALSAYAVKKNTLVGTGSGCGLNGDGNGWLNAGPSQIAAYPRSIVSCLQDEGLLTTGDFIDPSLCLWASGGDCGASGGLVKAYMKATCQRSSRTVTYVFAYIESEPRKDAEVDALCDANTVAGFNSVDQKWGTNYGMNYYVVAQ
jgi:prepilin-type N-terminal cleavage/methylation domain-containing protein